MSNHSFPGLSPFKRLGASSYSNCSSDNFSEFEEIFGNLDSRFYVPYTAKQYLKSAGTVTIVRVLGIGGYQANNINIKVSGSTANTAESYSHNKALSVLAPTRLSQGVNIISGSVKTTDNCRCKRWAFLCGPY